MHLQTKEHQGISPATRSYEEAKKGPPLEPSRKHGPVDLWIPGFWPLEPGGNYSVVLKEPHLGCSVLAAPGN
jgi:hypothetical protein